MGGGGGVDFVRPWGISLRRFYLLPSVNATVILKSLRGWIQKILRIFVQFLVVMSCCINKILSNRLQVLEFVVC